MCVAVVGCSLAAKNPSRRRVLSSPSPRSRSGCRCCLPMTLNPSASLPNQSGVACCAEKSPAPLHRATKRLRTPTGRASLRPRDPPSRYPFPMVEHQPKTGTSPHPQASLHRTPLQRLTSTPSRPLTMRDRAGGMPRPSPPCCTCQALAHTSDGSPSPDVRSQRTRPWVCFTGDAGDPLDPVDCLYPLEALNTLFDVALADTSRG